MVAQRGTGTGLNYRACGAGAGHKPRPGTHCPVLLPDPLSCPGGSKPRDDPCCPHPSPLIQGGQPGTAQLQACLKLSEAGPPFLEMSLPSGPHRNTQGGTCTGPRYHRGRGSQRLSPKEEKKVKAQSREGQVQGTENTQQAHTALSLPTAPGLGPELSNPFLRLAWEVMDSVRLKQVLGGDSLPHPWVRSPSDPMGQALCSCPARVPAVCWARHKLLSFPAGHCPVEPVTPGRRGEHTQGGEGTCPRSHLSQLEGQGANPHLTGPTAQF